MGETSCFVGIDVAKAHLDVALLPSQDTWRLAYEEPGLAGLVAQLQPLAPALIVVEATGGWEVPLVGALAAADLPVVV